MADNDIITVEQRLIGGLLRASEGKITIAGKDMTLTPPYLRPVNTVFQKYALFPHLNVYNNIAFGLKLKKLPEEIIKKKVMQVLKIVTMTDYEERDVDHSGIGYINRRLSRISPGQEIPRKKEKTGKNEKNLSE